MVVLDATAMRSGPVTFVGAVVANDGNGHRRIRLADPTGGPVHPPRRNGVPASGWDAEGVVVELPPGASRAVGYATAGEPADPPLTVESVRRVGDGQAVGDSGEGLASNPAAVVRAYGDPAPPRDAVPAVGPSVDGRPVAAGGESPADGESAAARCADESAGGAGDADDGEGHSNDPTAESDGEGRADAPGRPQAAPGTSQPAAAAAADGVDRPAGPASPPAIDRGSVEDTPTATATVELGSPAESAPHPDASTRTSPEQSADDAPADDRETTGPATTATQVEPTERTPTSPDGDTGSTLRAAERRVERAEALAAATDLETAAERVGAAGGLDGVRELARAVDRDATALDALARRAETLADRAEAVDIPLGTLERLA